MGVHQRDIRTVHMVDGLVMRGDHTLSPDGCWRATAAAFGVFNYDGTPLLWVAGDKVVGEMALTVAKPHAEWGAGFAGRCHETLLRFEVVPVQGRPMLRTWWAVGDNVARTARKARLEPLDVKIWPERFRQLLQLMNWTG